MKSNVICLVGKSGSGKSTIAMAAHNLGFRVVKSRTTRGMRENETAYSPICHHFLSMENYEKDKEDFNVIAETLFGDEGNQNMYWARPFDVLRDDTCFYVIDPNGVDYFKEYEKRYNAESEHSLNLFIAYIDVHDQVIFDRMKKDEPELLKVLARIKRDTDHNEDFKRIKSIADIIIDNNDDQQVAICTLIAWATKIS